MILLPLSNSGWDYSCVQDHTQLLMWVLGLNVGPRGCRAVLSLLSRLSGPRVRLASFLQWSAGACRYHFWVEFCGPCEGSVNSVSPISQLLGSVAPSLGLLPTIQQ